MTVFVIIINRETIREQISFTSHYAKVLAGVTALSPFRKWCKQGETEILYDAYFHCSSY